MDAKVWKTDEHFALRVGKLIIYIGRWRHYHYGETWYTPITFRWRHG